MVFKSKWVCVTYTVWTFIIYALSTFGNCVFLKGCTQKYILPCTSNVKRTMWDIGIQLTTYITVVSQNCDVPNSISFSWWRYQTESVSALLDLCEGNPPVTGGFPSQSASNTGFDVFFDICLNKRLNKQTSRWWFETPGCSLWRRILIYSVIPFTSANIDLVII